MTIKNFIQDIENKLPELASTNDLIELGIFTSAEQACLMRKRGDCPEHIKFSERRIIYPKRCVIRWLQSKASSYLES